MPKVMLEIKVPSRILLTNVYAHIREAGGEILTVYVEPEESPEPAPSSGLPDHPYVGGCFPPYGICGRCQRPDADHLRPPAYPERGA